MEGLAMKRTLLLSSGLTIAFTTLAGLAGCAGIPGATGEEQVQTIEELVERTLSDLYKQEPGTKAEIAKSVGYAIMDNKVTKIPLVGAGTGYGVAINNRTGEKTYIRMSRFDVGGGWGARSLRPVAIFQDEGKFKGFVDGTWSATAGAEAAAKVGEAGVAGGAASSDAASDKGYSLHIITDAGVSATVTVGVIHVTPVKLKE